MTDDENQVTAKPAIERGFAVLMYFALACLLSIVDSKSGSRNAAIINFCT
jgi:hypothetical protein